jgi:hypothetical protein
VRPRRVGSPAYFFPAKSSIRPEPLGVVLVIEDGEQSFEGVDSDQIGKQFLRRWLGLKRNLCCSFETVIPKACNHKPEYAKGLGGKRGPVKHKMKALES